MKEHLLTTPLKEEEIRSLEIGDLVYLSGTVFTLRDMGHRRIIDLIENNREEQIPFNLYNSTLWHCGPIVKLDHNNSWNILSAGSTTSSRYTTLGAKLIKHYSLRAIIGKGTMFSEAHRAMKESGCCYLNTSGGCAAFYAQQIKEVENVYWQDLGLPEATWELSICKLGPLIVGIDAQGNSLFDNMEKIVKKNLKAIYKRHNLKKSYVNLPKRVPASS